MSEGEPYSGLFGAYRYAFRRSDSRLFRVYVGTSAFVGTFIAILLVLGVVNWAGSAGQFGERALLSVIGVLVLGPLFGPVLIVARRYRLGLDRPGFDSYLALAGLGFLFSLYLALFVSDPTDHSAPGPLSTPVSVINDLPQTYGMVPPVVATVGLYLVVRYTRPGEEDPDEAPETA
ncbi:MAG: hypothetical protein ABEH88_00465 [Halobacteriales archaeon]